MTRRKRRYILQKGDKGIFLTVEKESNDAVPVCIEHLEHELSKRKLTYDPHIVEKCFEEATGEKVQIALIQEESFYAPILELKISDNKMSAILQVYPSLDNSFLQINDLECFLKEQGIKFGLKTDLFAEIVKKFPYYQEWTITEGKPSVNGENASLNFYFQKGGMDLKPKELEDGSVDFHDLNLIQIVESGTILVERIPPTPGINGSTVLGEVLKANPGKDLRLPLGLNTQIIDNYTKLISTKEGHVTYTNNKVNVYPIYEVKGDVDFNTGNIAFPGNVIIKGNVKNGFNVEAGGDVEIYGNLEGTVKAEGNLQIKKGIVRGTAKVNGSIYVRYIENGSAFSKENITVTEAIMHSTVKAEKKLLVNGKKGLIVGGSISAGEEICAKNIGSPLGTVTMLEVGISPELKDEYKLLCSKLKVHQENDDKNSKIINTFLKMKLEGKLTEKKEAIFIKVKRSQYQLQKEIGEFMIRKNELELLFRNMEQAKIQVMNTVYCGVVINIGKAILNIIEEKHRVEFRLDDYEIKEVNL